MTAIVFVNPPLSIQDRYGLKSQGGAETPPLGLACLAAMTRKCGYDTTIVDAAATNMSYEDITRAILERGCKYVGITAATISVKNAGRVAESIKAADKGITTIIGGPHLSALPEETMSRYLSFDIGVIGEGDYTIIDLLEHLETGKDLSSVKGLIYRNGGGFVTTDGRPRVHNLDELPFPAWDLLPNLAKFYCPPVHTLKRFPAALLIASRGCPGKCMFCARTVYGNSLRAHSAEYTFEMIKDLYLNYGIREIQIRDDNFVAYRQRLVRLCEILRREKLDLVWTCAGRVDMVTPAILKLMKEAGCWQIWYGIESGSQAILDTVKKNVTIKQIEDAVQMTLDAGISPCGFFIIGHPSETIETLEATVEFARRLRLTEAHFSFMTPFPGSELYERAEEYGVFHNDWTKLNGWQVTFVPHGLTAEVLEHYSKKAFSRFYFRPRIILSYIAKIRSWKHLRFYFLGLISLLEFLIRKPHTKRQV
jgi:radical SAM superfamily enzyme YgiQ (UPF0313 family)